MGQVLSHLEGANHLNAPLSKRTLRSYAYTGVQTRRPGPAPSIRRRVGGDPQAARRANAAAVALPHGADLIGGVCVWPGPPVFRLLPASDVIWKQSVVTLMRCVGD